MKERYVLCGQLKRRAFTNKWLYHLTVTIGKNLSLCNRDEELGEGRQTGR